MQLLAKIRRKNSLETTDQPLKPLQSTSSPSSSTTNLKQKPQPKRQRSGFGIFTRSLSNTSTPTSSQSTSPNSTSPSSPNPTSNTALPATTTTPAATTTPTRPRQLVRVQSIMYCPTLDKNGTGFGNEENRRTAEF